MVSVPAHAVALISADSKYWLWVNGILAVREGQLKRGPAPGDSFFDEVDLAPYLHAGRNQIAALLWYWGRSGFSHASSGQPAFLFQLELEAASCDSDSSWKARAHAGARTTGPLRPNYRLPEGNVRWDGREDMGEWTIPGFDDSSWPDAGVLGTPPCAPWGRLWPRGVPQWRDGDIRPYERLEGRLLGPSMIRARLPHVAQVYPWLRVDAKAGRVVRMRMDNYWHHSLELSQPVKAEYVTSKGVQEVELPGWMSGQSVHYRVPRGVRVLELGYRETGYAAGFAGSFTCNDELLNTLWMKARRSLYVCMRDSYMDCPDRERAQWWGDVVIEMGAAPYCMDPRAGLLARKAIHDLVLHARPEGELYSPIPGCWDKELPQQMLAAVSAFGIFTYGLHTGDIEPLRAAHPAVQRYLSLWQTGDDGLVLHRRGGWDWIDWGPRPDRALLENCWYALALDGAARIAELAGDRAKAAENQARRRALLAAINRSMWTGRDYRSARFRGGRARGAADDRGNALAVLCGAAQQERFAEMRHVLAESYNASPYMERYVLDALFAMGEADAAIARLKTRYSPLASSPISTLPERWNPKRPDSSYNHGYNAGLITLLSGRAAGVAPLTMGYKSYEVRPRMGALTAAQCTVQTVRGRIDLKLERDDAWFLMSLSSPEGRKPS